MKPSFHADHIGSLLRPERLIAAARSAREGKLDAAGFRAVQDECIKEAVALQESLGVPAVTDGEFRRRACARTARATAWNPAGWRRNTKR